MAVANKRVPKAASRDEACTSMMEVLARVGDKWTIMIVGALSEGSMRYGDIQRHIGDISQRMLTLTLKGLTEDKLVSRTVYPTIPPRVDYELTELGFSLREALIPLRDWATKNTHVLTATKRLSASQLIQKKRVQR